MSLNLSSAHIDTIVSIGPDGGPNAPATLMGGQLVVYSESPLQGGRSVVVYDLTRGQEVRRYEGTQGIAADDEHTIVFWKMATPREARLTWQDLRGSSGTIGVTVVTSAAFLEPPVRVGKGDIVYALGGHLAMFDARTKTVRSLGLSGLTPVCDAGDGTLLCRLLESRQLVLVDLSTARTVKSLGMLRGVGWTRDPVNGGVLFATPSDSWWRPEEYDLASLDLKSGRVVRGVRGFLMVGGVVVSRAPPQSH